MDILLKVSPKEADFIFKCIAEAVEHIHKTMDYSVGVSRVVLDEAHEFAFILRDELANQIDRQVDAQQNGGLSDSDMASSAVGGAHGAGTVIASVAEIDPVTAAYKARSREIWRRAERLNDSFYLNDSF